jgi:putative ABC transport system substrate-binding protein
LQGETGPRLISIQNNSGLPHGLTAPFVASSVCSLTGALGRAATANGNPMFDAKRREFMALLGGAAAWPLAARAQQAAMPMVGFLDLRSPDAMEGRLRGFRQGLRDTGNVEGDNVTIAYRWAENKADRLPELVAELIRGRIAVIIASGGVAVAVAAKAATTTIPILFIVSEDPVRLGLVASLARPSGNLTGVNFFNTELAAKQLELLRELLPRAARVAVFINPASATAETTLRDVEPAARAIGLQIQVLRASTSQEIDTAFATFARERPDALFISNEGFLNSRRVQLVQLAAHHRVPAIYSGREYSEIGGLMSYGTNVADAYRQLGVYAGRILKGAKPADLPVVQPSKFELVINHQTARMLGLTVPDKLLVAADEVIE